MYLLAVEDFQAYMNQRVGLGTFLKVLLSHEFRATLAYRFYSWLYRQRASKLLGFLLFQRSKRIYGIDIHPLAEIGGGFVFSHTGAIVIGGQSKIGKNLVLHSGVTIGESIAGQGMPTIGDNVNIGTGAKVLGRIEIESGTIIGANAVVLKSFPTGVLVGVPAI